MTRVEIYGLIRIGGMLAFIPFALAAAPLAGFFAGEFLEARCGGKPYVSYVCALVGLVAGIRETVRILKIALKLESSGEK